MTTNTERILALEQRGKRNIAEGFLTFSVGLLSAASFLNGGEASIMQRETATTNPILGLSLLVGVLAYGGLSLTAPVLGLGEITVGLAQLGLAKGRRFAAHLGRRVKSQAA